jgi:uncharacterized protein YuzE
MKKARFKANISLDEETGKLIAVYLRVREGATEETVELEEDAAYADYDADGQLLGVELLAPCAVEVLDKLTQSEPDDVREFLHASPPRAMVLC